MNERGAKFTVGLHYDFYKVYKTKPEDVELWEGKQREDLPYYLQFFCDEYDDSDNHDQLAEIQNLVLPISMFIEDREFQGYLATLYPVADFGKSAWKLAYKSPRNGYCHFVRLTNSRAKRMLKFAVNDFIYINFFGWSINDLEEYRNGILGKKKNKFKHYHGKIRNIVFYIEP